uniref:CBS domain-containing protein CBSX1 n=1 Tax=Rhizophora mucronata TaxID=61149 RepID=A0A2P2KXI9_RHIMU
MISFDLMILHHLKWSPMLTSHNLIQGQPISNHHQSQESQ